MGEYLSPGHNARCTPDDMAKLYDTLEILAYEISRAGHAASSSDGPVFSARLCSVLMTSVAKVGGGVYCSGHVAILLLPMPGELLSEGQLSGMRGKNTK